MKKWGVDLGGTKIECAVIEDGRALVRKRIATEASGGYHHILNRIKSLVDDVSEEIGMRPERIGFGTPGTLDRHTGKMKNCNTVCMNGMATHLDLAEMLGAEIKIANDANCFALAEALYGAGKEMPDAEVVFGIIMGTGVGGGLVVNGKVIEGAHGVAGEWGHNQLIENGDQCYCSTRGCVETAISGTALEKHYSKIAGRSLPLKEIAMQRDSDLAAAATISHLIEYFGRAVASLINVIDPELIIIGGGVGNVDALYTEGVESISRHMFEPGPLRTKVVRPSLGDSAGVFGAATLFD